MKTIAATVLCGLLASLTFGKSSFGRALPKELRNLSPSQLDAINKFIAYKLDTAKAVMAFNVRAMDGLSDGQRQLVSKIIDDYSDISIASNEELDSLVDDVINLREQEELDSLVDEVLNLREQETRIVSDKEYLALKSLYSVEVITTFDDGYYRVRTDAPDYAVGFIISLTDEQIALLVRTVNDRDNSFFGAPNLSPSQSSEQSTVKN